MTMQAVVTTGATARTTGLSRWSVPGLVSPAEAGKIVVSFLDAATTSLGRATHYNSREEQQRAELLAHDALLWLDRDLYAVLLALPGVTDRARQVGVKNLLGSPRGGGQGMLTAEMERGLLIRLVGELPAQRLLKLFDALRVGAPEEGIRKANNARTRKLVLGTLLGSPRLELWAVKYRTKVAAALTHVWGLRKTSVIRAVLGKPEETRSPKERAILAGAIDRFAPGHALGKVRECVAFVLGFRGGLTLPLFTAFVAAKDDLAAGAALPLEVLEGIRSVFHRGTPREETLRLAAPNLTAGQRMSVQKRAEEAKVDVKMDPADYDAVKLYVYAFEMGMTVEIARALLDKARIAARSFPVRYGTIGVLVDASASMAGSSDQKLRPMAAALALRDLLQHTAQARVVHAGGTAGGAEAMLVRPSGDTGLSEALLDLLETLPEAIFVVSDGYENRPAGRFAEIVSELRRLGDGDSHLPPEPGLRGRGPGGPGALPGSRSHAAGLAAGGAGAGHAPQHAGDRPGPGHHCPDPARAPLDHWRLR